MRTQLNVLEETSDVWMMPDDWRISADKMSDHSCLGRPSVDDFASMVKLLQFRRDVCWRSTACKRDVADTVVVSQEMPRSATPYTSLINFRPQSNSDWLRGGVKSSIYHTLVITDFHQFKTYRSIASCWVVGLDDVMASSGLWLAGRINEGDPSINVCVSLVVKSMTNTLSIQWRRHPIYTLRLYTVTGVRHHNYTSYIIYSCNIFGLNSFTKTRKLNNLKCRVLPDLVTHFAACLYHILSDTGLLLHCQCIFFSIFPYFWCCSAFTGTHLLTCLINSSALLANP